MAESVIEVERDIVATPDVVWSLVSDVTRMGQWSPETESCAWLGGASGPTPGARFRGRNRNGWRRWSTTSRVVAAEQPVIFAFEVTSLGMKVARWSFTVEPTAQGCRLRQSWTDQRGHLITWLGALATGVTDRAAHNRRGMDETLRRVAAAAEAPTRDR